jgi:hypothetical protein
VPIAIWHDPSKPLEVNIVAKVPDGWKVKSGSGKVALPAESSTNLRVDIDTPILSSDQLKGAKLQDVVVEVEAGGAKIGEILLRVKLGTSGLPE